MNKWLANCVAKSNAAIAILAILVGVILAVSAAIGAGVGIGIGSGVLAGALAAGGALIFVIMFCGPMAVILDIRDQLVKLNSGLVAK